MKILVTGAGSPIGKVVCKYLAARHSVIPWVSERNPLDTGRVVNLLQPLGRAECEEAREASAVLHLAWLRARSVREAVERNREMLFSRFVEEAGCPPKKLYLLSSVAASPSSRSSYAQAKSRVAEDLVSRGGTAIACGLVTSAPAFGPYRMLHNFSVFPLFRLVFSSRSPGVYPVRLESLGAGIQAILESNECAAAYRLFAPPIPINTFIAKTCGYTSSGLPITFWTPGLLSVAGILRGIGIPPWKLWDKLLTFLHKDAAFLDGLKPIHGWDPGDGMLTACPPSQ